MYLQHTHELDNFIDSLNQLTINSSIESISEPYDIETEYSSTWPNNEKAGIYLFFTSSFELLYVGKSSHIGSRLNKYFQYSEDKRSGIPIDEKSKGSRYIITIGLLKGYEWLAPSLEEYFIMKLKPVKNKIGNY